MANKFIFKLQGNDFVITDDVDTSIEKLRYSRDKIRFNINDNDNYFFKKILTDTIIGNPNNYPFADIINDINGGAFASVNDLNVFLSSNIGPVYDPSVGGVTSVNGQTGVVVLDADDIDDSATVNKFSSNFNIDLDSSEASVVRVFAGGRTTYTITHALNSLDVTAQTFRLSNGRTVGLRVERTGVNTIEVSRSGNSADGIYRVLIGKIG